MALTAVTVSVQELWTDWRVRKNQGIVSQSEGSKPPEGNAHSLPVNVVGVYPRYSQVELESKVRQIYRGVVWEVQDESNKDAVTYLLGNCTDTCIQIMKKCLPSIYYSIW